MIDGEQRIPVEHRQGQRRVEEAHMVERDDRIGAGFGEVLQAARFDAEGGAKNEPEEISQCACRHREEDPHRA